MATRIPLVIVNGQIEQLQTGDTISLPEYFSGVNDNAGAIVIGAPIYAAAAGHYDKARANAAGTKDVVGLAVLATVASGGTIYGQSDGLFTATTAQWDAVTGETGGLTFNTIYYLDPATAGKLTATPTTTTGQYVCKVLKAISTTEAIIEIGQTILL